jgi:hypothetical protein
VQLDALKLELPCVFNDPPHAAEFEVMVQFVVATVENSRALTPPPFELAEFKESVHPVVAKVLYFRVATAPPNIAWFEEIVQSAALTTESSVAQNAPPYRAELSFIVLSAAMTAESAAAWTAPPQPEARFEMAVQDNMLTVEKSPA